MDFKECLYDPNDKKLVEKLQLYEEFKAPLGVLEKHRVALYRYVIMMYDIKSPYRYTYADFGERRREAAREAGMQLNRNREFVKEVEDALIGVNDTVSKMIVKYLMLQGIREFTALEGCASQFEAETEKLIQRKGDMNTYKLQKALMQDMKEYEKIIFGGQEILDVSKALYQSLEAKRKAPRPEDMAKRFMEKPDDNLDDFCPYDEDYKVDKLKFVGDEPPV